MSRESLNAEGFGGVVTRVEEVHAEFFRECVGVVGAFAAEKGVAAEFGSLGNFRAGSPAADTDFANALASARGNVDAPMQSPNSTPNASSHNMSTFTNVWWQKRKIRPEKLRLIP